MSVLSKALRFAVIGIMLSGCAINSRPATTDLASNETVTSGGAVDSSVENSNQALASPSLAPTESRELAAASDTGMGIAIERGNGFTRLMLDTRTQPTLDVMSMEKPARLVVDLIGEPGKSNKSFPIGDDKFVKSVRVGAHKEKARVVFDLTEYAADQGRVERLVDSENGKISITFSDTQVAQAPAAEAVHPTLDAEIPVETIQPKTETAAVPAPQPAETTAAAASTEPNTVVSSIKLAKSKNDSGTVSVALNNESVFQLERTAPSEYVLTIPGASASEPTRLPQIAPAGASGIRSARAVEQNGNVLVRMFTDPDVDLKARTQGSEIIVEAANATLASARAQMGPEKTPAAPAKEAAPAPAPGAGDEAAAKAPAGTVVASDGSKVYSGRLISLDLQDTDIDNALRIIAEVSNLNIIASDDVTGKVTLRLIDVPWDQALDVILKTNGLDQVTEGNVIRIAPVEKLRQEREALAQAKAAAINLEDLTPKYWRVSYAKASELKEAVEAILSERGSATVDERTNQLIIKDIASGHSAAEELIKKLDLRTPQVLLETQIVEASRNIFRDLGFQWNFAFVQSPETGNATGMVFPNSVNVAGSGASGNAVNFPAAITDEGSAITAVLDSADGSRLLSARISALETEGKIQVISRPQVATINNKEAEIKSVETVRVRLPSSGTSVATGSGASASAGGSSAFEEIEVGITMTVTPQASPDYYVLLDLNTKSSTFGGRTVDGIPSTFERKATSSILVKSGQTFALGGVYRLNDSDRLSGVPFLKDIPFFGHLFRRTVTDKTDEELIFFITPHIVEGSFDTGAM